MFWLLAALETALFAGALYGFGTDEPGLRALVRLTGPPRSPRRSSICRSPR